MLKFDEYDFENTAMAVMVMNESAAEKYDSWEELMDFMRAMAHQYCYTSNSFSTGGFVLTAYNGHDGVRNVRASVSAYVANRYVNKMMEAA